MASNNQTNLQSPQPRQNASQNPSGKINNSVTVKIVSPPPPPKK